MPQAYVIYTSFKNTQGKIFVDGYSLQSYQTAIGKLGRSIQNTIIIPCWHWSSSCCWLFSSLIWWCAAAMPLTNVVDVLPMIPYIVPGTVAWHRAASSASISPRSSAAPCSSW
ncbi:MAG: hypothetical protein ACLVES_06365 [Faecalibacterium prausnitzii]